MSASSEKLTERVARATQRLAVMKARQLMRELRAEQRAKQSARRFDTRRRLEMGGAVLAAGCTDFGTVELVGLLLDAKDRIGNSPTMRLAARKRGQDWLSAATSVAIADDGKSPPSPGSGRAAQHPS